MVAHELDVGVHRKTNGRQNSTPFEQRFAPQAGRLGKPQPSLDASRAARCAIVILDARAPIAAKSGVFTAGQNHRVFDGHAALVIKAVKRPSLQLSAGQQTLVHAQMERMAVMIPLFANGLEPLLKLRGQEKGGNGFTTCVSVRHQH